MLAIDTLQLSKDLETVFTPEQAEVLVKVFAIALTQDLVTKQDLSATKQELTQELRSEIQRLETKIDTQAASIRAEIKDLKAEMIKWIAGALVVNFFGVAGLVVTLIKSIAH